MKSLKQAKKDAEASLQRLERTIQSVTSQIMAYPKVNPKKVAKHPASCGSARSLKP